LLAESRWWLSNKEMSLEALHGACVSVACCQFKWPSNEEMALEALHGACMSVACGQFERPSPAEEQLALVPAAERSLSGSCGSCASVVHVSTWLCKN
jgi:hypothetical protein